MQKFLEEKNEFSEARRALQYVSAEFYNDLCVLMSAHALRLYGAHKKEKKKKMLMSGDRSCGQRHQPKKKKLLN